MTPGYCPSCELSLFESPGMGCNFPQEHQKSATAMPQESYRGPEPRDEGWTWPATTAFIALLAFIAFVVWVVWG